MGQRIDVAIGVLIETRDGRPCVLIARRPAGAVLSGLWELPGGKVESGESPRDCLVREFREELGVGVRVGEALEVIEHDYPHGRVRLHPFLCTPQNGEPRNLQVAEHRWVTPEELSRYDFPPANRELMEHLTRRLLAEQQGHAT
jgi:mutator protein MutT